MKPRIPLSSFIGQKLGRLTIINIYRDAKSNILAKAICECGNDWTGYFVRVQSGNTYSCGCYAKELKQKSFKLQAMKRKKTPRKKLTGKEGFYWQ